MTFDALGGFTLTEKHNITGVLAVHGLFSYTGSIDAVESYGAFGLIPVEDDAMSVLQVPEPFADGDAPWMVHHFFEARQKSSEVKELRFHGKARRRISIKNSLAFVLDVDSFSDGAIAWSIFLRILLQRGR